MNLSKLSRLPGCSHNLKRLRDLRSCSQHRLRLGTSLWPLWRNPHIDSERLC